MRQTAGARRSIRARIFASVATVTLLLGCTASEADRPIFGDLNSQRMLQVGLSDIQQIYIDEPMVADLAVAGLKGLQRIEPELDVERENDIVKISLRHSEAGFAKAPQSDDAFMPGRPP
jgi:hypothetical protein